MDSISLTKEQAERPGAYVFWLGNVCQYVGGSGQCISRATNGKHDARDKWRKKGLDYDRIQFFFTQTEGQAWELEENLARSLKPKYGTHRGDSVPSRGHLKGKKWPAARRRHYELYGN